jgi:hypothetical protein
MYGICIWKFTDYDALVIDTAYREFEESTGKFPNVHRYLFSRGIMFLELRYRPTDEEMEEGDGQYYSMRVALDPYAEQSNI